MLLVFFLNIVFCTAFVPSLEDQKAWSGHARWLYNQNLTMEELTTDKQGNPLSTAIYDIIPSGIDSNAPVALFLHGQPTWSYLHREIIQFIVGCREADYPALEAGQDPWCTFGEMEPVGRVLAFDYIGFGQSSNPGDPTIYEYRIRDHVAQLEAVLEAKLPRSGTGPPMTAISHDWGVGILLSYLSRHTETHGIHSWITSEGVAFASTTPPFLFPFFGELHSLAGYQFCLDENWFVEVQVISPDDSDGPYGKVLGSQSFRVMDDNEKMMFREPQGAPEERWGQFAFVNEVPTIPSAGMDPEGNQYAQGFPSDVANMIDGGLTALFDSCTPTLLMNVDPGALSSFQVPLFEGGFANCLDQLYETDTINSLHYFFVDHPFEYGCAVRNFFIDMHGLDEDLKISNCAAISSLDPQTEGCGYEPGLVAGTRLDILDSADYSACCEACKMDGQCAVWNFNEGSKMCLLFSSEHRDLSSDDWVHGRVQRQTSGDLDVRTDISEGAPIDVITLTSGAGPLITSISEVSSTDEN